MDVSCVADMHQSGCESDGDEIGWIKSADSDCNHALACDLRAGNWKMTERTERCFGECCIVETLKVTRRGRQDENKGTMHDIQQHAGAAVWFRSRYCVTGNRNEVTTTSLPRKPRQHAEHMEHTTLIHQWPKGGIDLTQSGGL